MEIRSTTIYNLERAIRTSHYPKATESFLDYSTPATEQDLKRMRNLGTAKPSTGHDNALSGVLVAMDLRAPEYFWSQFKRYHFQQVVSSQSKMHMITEMDLDEQLNAYVDPRAKAILREYIRAYLADPTDDGFQRIVSNTPMGIELTAGITTNYLQLKTMHLQRKNHDLAEWDYFCEWCESLPLFTDLTQKEGSAEPAELLAKLHQAKYPHGNYIQIPDRGRLIIPSTISDKGEQ